MTLTGVEQVAVLLAAAMLMVMVGAAAVVVVRVRNRWRRRRSLVHALFPRLARGSMLTVTESVVGTVGSLSWWLVQRDRHAMWRSVAAARQSVAVAARADAPLGELPMLMRQLHRAADGVDAALRASAGQRRPPAEVTADRIRIEAAAAEIRAAALTSLDATRVGVQPLASAISVEVAALAAGVRAARATASPWR